MSDSAEWIVDGDSRAEHTLVLAHGAGAPMDSDFMSAVATGVAGDGIRVVRFEFPYMARRRVDGSKRPPNSAKVLQQTWLDVLSHLGDPSRLVVGGKSMGGRIASMIADAAGVGGLVCLGYPFHPPGKPDRLRTEHLKVLRTPALIVQGERDAFGGRADVDGYGLSDAIEMSWMFDGDHSFVPRVKSGGSLQANLAAAVTGVARFVRGLV